MLVEIADRMTTTIRRGDSIASVGVDELAALVEVRSVDGSRVSPSASWRRRRTPARLRAASGGHRQPRCRDGLPLGQPDVVIEQPEHAMRASRGTGGEDRPSGAGIDLASAPLAKSPVPSGHTQA